jgi:hypothetical protein
MTDHAQKNLRSYSAYFLKVHGLYYPESDPLLPALYSIHLEMEQNSQTNREIASDLDHARIIIGSSSNADELLKRVKKDNEGFYYLDFSAASGNSVKSFNDFRILNPKTVRVYIGKETK